MTGVAVQTPTGSAYAVTSVTTEIHDVLGGTSFTLDLYSDAGGGIWDTLIATIGTQTGGAADSMLEYTFTPASPIALDPDTVYWFVLSSPNADDCAIGWSSQQSDPTGVFSRVAEIQVFSGSTDDLTGDNIALEINAELGVPSMPRWALIVLAMVLMLGAGLALRGRPNSRTQAV